MFAQCFHIDIWYIFCDKFCHLKNIDYSCFKSQPTEHVFSMYPKYDNFTVAMRFYYLHSANVKTHKSDIYIWFVCKLVYLFLLIKWDLEHGLVGPWPCLKHLDNLPGLTADSVSIPGCPSVLFVWSVSYNGGQQMYSSLRCRKLAGSWQSRERKSTWREE